MAMGYFTKWTEAAPLATITMKKVIDFGEQYHMQK